MSAQRLPEKMVLKPSRLKWILILAVGLAFTAIAIWVPAEGDNAWRWFVGGLFGLLSAIAVPAALGIGSGLELNRVGFRCRTLFRTWNRQWRDCSEFAPISIGPNTFVGFSTLSDEKAHPNLAAANRAIAGTSGMLPDTYGMSPQDLADTMNRFRARALGDER